MVDLVRKSIGASLLISLGVSVLLSIGNPIGPFLFSFGLLGICILNLNLFTGKCGYLFENNLRFLDLIVILISNLISGYFFGLILGFSNNSLYSLSLDKISVWSFDFSFFIKSIFCGIIMYLCVDLYKKGVIFGIFLGVPLFIFCGFQHCIANIILLGMARTFDFSIFICILGNFLGSLFISFLVRDYRK